MTSSSNLDEFNEVLHNTPTSISLSRWHKHDTCRSTKFDPPSAFSSHFVHSGESGESLLLPQTRFELLFPPRITFQLPSSPPHHSSSSPTLFRPVDVGFYVSLFVAIVAISYHCIRPSLSSSFTPCYSLLVLPPSSPV